MTDVVYLQELCRYSADEIAKNKAAELLQRVGLRSKIDG
jgi:hypothetical protein